MERLNAYWNQRGSGFNTKRFFSPYSSIKQWVSNVGKVTKITDDEPRSRGLVKVKFSEMIETIYKIKLEDHILEVTEIVETVKSAKRVHKHLGVEKFSIR